MIDENKKQALDFYDKGISAYFGKNFDEAIGWFKKVLELTPDDFVAELHLHRCIEYKKNPPAEDWDGVFKLTTK